MPGSSLTLRPLTHKTRAIARELLYASGMRRLRPASMREGMSIRLPEPAAARLPEECACCAQAASHSSALRRRDGLSLRVGYCEDCAEHQAKSSARVLALGLASVLLGLATAAGVPLVAPRLGLLGLLLLVLASCALPLFGLLLPVGDVIAPHVARGPAVLWGPDDQLWCAAASYAERVAAQNGGDARPARMRESIGSAWLSAGPVLSVGAACLSFFVYHPLLRILNLGPARVEVAIDGKRLTSVDPTSNESPAGGALLRVPAGEHTLSVISSVDGSALGDSAVEFHSGAVHLFAVSAENTCFWLETNGYGQERRVAPSYQALRSAGHFWVLPGGIDTWFAPNPHASDSNSHSSGGLLTALRQAPCAEAPPEVRPAQ